MSNDMYYDNITGEMLDSRPRVGRHQKGWSYSLAMLDKDLADYTKPNQGRRAAR